MRSDSRPQPAVKLPLALAWNINCPQPGPALWFQFDSDIGRIQYSIVALSYFEPNTPGMVKPVCSALRHLLLVDLAGTVALTLTDCLLPYTACTAYEPAASSGSAYCVVPASSVANSSSVPLYTRKPVSTFFEAAGLLHVRVFPFTATLSGAL